MSYYRNLLILLLSMLFLVWATLSYAEVMDNGSTTKSSLIMQVEINGVIGPAMADYIERNLHKAITRQAQALLIIMDTPGGLDISMRHIIKSIIASPIPVITYVFPGGARAASAGTYLLYASHIAAMAPATNLGAATPVQIGGFGALDKDKDENAEHDNTEQILTDPMTHKAVNDAAAYIRGLAEIHDRNAQWAEQAVREAASLSAREALKLKVIDIVADDVDDLFKQLQGRELKVDGKQLVFKTGELDIQRLKPDWRSEFLGVITHPGIAYILLMAGMYGLVLEFANPGSIVPGTIGGICLLLALYALQLLPVNYAGMGLILLGMGLMIAEAFAPSFGVLGLGGIVSFVIGSVILIDTDVPGFGIDLGLVAAFALSSAAFFIIAIGLLFKSRHNPVVSGREEMQGGIGVALDDFTGTGMIRIHSEIWQATSDQPLHKNEHVRVVSIQGLMLKVAPVKQEDK